MDSETKPWIRNASDELAARAGCVFREERGHFVVEWAAKYCRLYEGDWAGQPMTFTDWQLDCTLRLFSWVKWSEKWNRWVRRFRQASIWIAKKNKKSPTLAAWGLYLLAGDGEQGQKVFLAAKDGNQAREIAGKHAVEMLRQSPELMDECKLNQQTLQITHLPTRSIMLPLSSGDERHRQSKEGINGSVLIDEVHVVDREFVRRVSRAGISRSEPLQIEVSTAGNNPDGYGKERFDYALRVERGDTEDQDLFVAVYAAPQELADVDLEADPLKYGRMANPAMGHTVDPEEYLADYRTSKRSIAAMLDFKMYRLNVWQRSSNPWLRAGDWAACRQSFVAEDLAGQVCYAGLDLSRTRDMTALALAFPGEDEEVSLLPFFWLPEGRIAELEHLVPDLRAWARAGHLILTPGDVIDFGWIRSKYRELDKLYQIRELAYDPRFAEETTQAIAEGVVDASGRVVEEGTGVERYSFAQTYDNYAAPTADFERLVIAGKLRHNGHPVLSWQAGHAHVKRMPSGAKKVMKPTETSHLTVDGIQATIMALARATIATRGSVYDARGVLTLGGPTPSPAATATSPVTFWHDDPDDD